MLGRGSAVVLLAAVLAACGTVATRPRVEPTAPAPATAPATPDQAPVLPSPAPTPPAVTPPPLILSSRSSARPPVAPAPSAAAASTVILPVPFTVQAPTGDWTRDQESCEEAAAVMYHHYLGGDRAATIPAQQAEAEISALRAWEDQHWGAEPDLSMQRLGELNQGYYGYSVTVAPATQEAIMAQIRAGHPVIVPATTGVLRTEQPGFNPHHSLYHVLMIKGFDAGRAVANDEGVSQGRSWHYDWSVIFRAMDDANTRIPQGRVMLVLS